jgi:hypothetical protein
VHLGTVTVVWRQSKLDISYLQGHMSPMGRLAKQRHRHTSFERPTTGEGGGATQPGATQWTYTIRLLVLNGQRTAVDSC